MKSHDYYRVTKLDNDLWAIEDIKSSENSISYLLCGKNKALLFDTGPGLAPLLPTIKSITRLPIIVCLSHWHFDHTGSAHEFNSIIGWNTKEMRLASKHGINNGTIANQVGPEFWQSIDSTSLAINRFSQINLISKEFVLGIGGYRLNILHTPGHSEDSLCLYEPNRQWLFSGDTAYPGPIYLHLKESSLESYKSTINRLLSYNIKTIYPGHNTTEAPKVLLDDINSLINGVSTKSANFPSLSS